MISRNQILVAGPADPSGHPEVLGAFNSLEDGVAYCKASFEGEDAVKWEKSVQGEHGVALQGRNFRGRTFTLQPIHINVVIR